MKNLVNPEEIRRLNGDTIGIVRAVQKDSENALNEKI